MNKPLFVILNYTSYFNLQSVKYKNNSKSDARFMALVTDLRSLPEYLTNLYCNKLINNPNKILIGYQLSNHIIIPTNVSTKKTNI